MSYNAVILEAVKLTIDYLSAWGWKTYEYFLNVLRRSVRAVYNGNMGGEFMDVVGGLIAGQVQRAWGDGMAANGLTPADMTEEWQSDIDAIVDNEVSHLRDFYEAIIDARVDQSPLQPLLDRAETWANRYTDVVTRARVATADKKKRFKWVLGATEKHCETCGPLAGIVATAEAWDDLRKAGIYPRSWNLECRGVHCDCDIIPTDDDLTPGGIPSARGVK